MVKFSTKENFQATPDAKMLHELVVSSGFQKAGAAALQHYQDLLTQSLPLTGEAKASCFDKLMGAREFWGVLLNLTEKPPEPTPKPSQNLNHRI